MVKNVYILGLSFALLFIVITVANKAVNERKITNTETHYKEFFDNLNFDSVEIDGIKSDTFRISKGTFNIETFVLLTADTAVAKKVTGWDEIGFANGLTTEGFIWIKDPYDRGVVAHEILHQAWLTLRFSQVPINDQTDEVLAYEVERMTNEFYKNWFNGKK